MEVVGLRQGLGIYSALRARARFNAGSGSFIGLPSRGDFTLSCVFSNLWVQELRKAQVASSETCARVSSDSCGL